METICWIGMMNTLRPFYVDYLCNLKPLNEEMLNRLKVFGHTAWHKLLFTCGFVIIRLTPTFEILQCSLGSQVRVA